MRSSVPAQSNSRPTPTWLKDLNTEPTQPQGNRADKHNKKEALYPGMYLEPRYRLSAAAYFQLLQNLMHVVLNRGGTNCELTGNIFVGAALLDESKDLLLTEREGRGRFG